MRPQRRLALRREALSELDPGHLRSVVGGTHVPTDCGCITHGYSCDDCPVPTLPVNDCVQIDLTRQCVNPSLNC